MKLEQFLDSHLAGWQSHIIGELKQKTITTHVICPNADYLSFSKYNIILAGIGATVIPYRPIYSVGNKQYRQLEN